MVINHYVEFPIYGHLFEFDFTAEVTFDLDHEHSEEGWYVDEDVTVDRRGYSAENVTHIQFDETITPVILAEIRKQIDDIMACDSIRHHHRSEIDRERERGFKKWEVAR